MEAVTRIDLQPTNQTPAKPTTAMPYQASPSSTDTIEPITPEQRPNGPNSVPDKCSDSYSPSTTRSDRDTALDIATPSPSSLLTDAPSSPPQSPDSLFLQDHLQEALGVQSRLHHQVTSLQQALARQAKEYEARLASEQAWAASAVQNATDIASSFRDATIELTAETNVLRARIAELEHSMHAMQLGTDAKQQQKQQDEEDVGNEQLIAALQVEIADLERQVHRAHRSKVAALENEDAALQRADILGKQVERLAQLLDAERAEKEALQSALELVGLLPPSPTHTPPKSIV